MEKLKEQGFISSVGKNAKKTIYLCLPDSDREHWAEPYWNDVDLLTKIE